MSVPESPVTRERVEAIVSEWSEDPRSVAETVVETYGPPDEASPSRLVWFGNGPWKRTVLRREGAPHKFPLPHTDYLEQVIDYGVPPDRYDELGEFDGSVIVRRTRGELAAECHGEPANFLALNLAHDVLTGEKSVSEAREDYGLIMARRKAGGSPAYTQGFQFSPPEGDQGDPDETIVTDEVERKAKELVGAEGE